ncbi:ribonuclease H-like protein, partial [Glonium stellatum]
VALDCEMVGVKGGRSELALLSAVDYITGEVLINTFVYPNVKVVDWRTCFSGITPSAMNLAKSEGRILGGWEEARSELWKHIDASTILVGHALQHDLDVLRVVHNRVVDSGILAKNAVGAGVRRQWGLKILCAEFLGTKIQNHGKKGHDCLEDTYATREV